MQINTSGGDADFDAGEPTWSYDSRQGFIMEDVSLEMSGLYDCKARHLVTGLEQLISYYITVLRMCPYCCCSLLVPSCTLCMPRARCFSLLTLWGSAFLFPLSLAAFIWADDSTPTYEMCSCYVFYKELKEDQNHHPQVQMDGGISSSGQDDHPADDGEDHQGGGHWSYDPREGFILSQASLLEHHGYFECHARSRPGLSNSLPGQDGSDERIEVLSFILTVLRKFAPFLCSVLLLFVNQFAFFQHELTDS